MLHIYFKIKKAFAIKYNVYANEIDGFPLTYFFRTYVQSNKIYINTQIKKKKFLVIKFNKTH